MFRAIIIFFFILFSNTGFGQTDSLKLKLPVAGESEKLEILQSLTRKYMFQSLDSCVKYGNMAINLAREIGDIENEAIANKRIGYAHFSKGEYERSLKFYQKAFDLFLEIEEYLDAAVITNFIGDTYNQMGDYNKAIDYFVQTEKCCDTLILNGEDQASVKRLYAILYTNIGLVYHRLDSINKPLNYFEKALEYAEQINDSVRITASYSNIGMIYKKQQKYDKAFKMYFDALKIAEKINHKHYQSAILNNIANIYVHREIYDSALVYFRAAKNIITDIGDKYGLSLVNNNMAGVYLNMGDYKMALKTIRKALAISEEIKSQKEIYSNYEMLSNIYYKIGDKNKAFDYYKRFVELRDSVQGKETREAIADIQTKYETEKKEKENLNLRKDNEIKELLISRKNQTLVTTFVIISILVALVIVILNLLRKRNLAYASLVKQNLKTLKLEKERESKIRELQPRIVLDDKGDGSKDQFQLLAHRFEKFLIEEKPYLWEDLSMEEICKKLNTNRTYLSKAINEYFNLAFNDVICDFRIRAAKDLLADPENENITIEGIGQMAGFKSNSLFHKKFKSNTGITPLFFRENSKVS